MIFFKKFRAWRDGTRCRAVFFSCRFALCGRAGLLDSMAGAVVAHRAFDDPPAAGWRDEMSILLPEPHQSTFEQCPPRTRGSGSARQHSDPSHRGCVAVRKSHPGVPPLNHFVCCLGAAISEGAAGALSHRSPESCSAIARAGFRR